MESLTPPGGVLTDGLVTLRLPSVTDADALVGYAAGQDGGLGGSWLPALKAGASREHCLWMIDDWLAGWSGGGSYNGPALVLESGQSPAPVGLVGFVPRDAGTIELVFGVAPSWRGRGLATRAVVLAADWLIRERGAAMVELRIAPDSPACQRVAAKAGFRAAGTVSGVIEATGQEVENLRYIAAASTLTAGPRAVG